MGATPTLEQLTPGDLGVRLLSSLRSSEDVARCTELGLTPTSFPIPEHAEVFAELLKRDVTLTSEDIAAVLVDKGITPVRRGQLDKLAAKQVADAVTFSAVEVLYRLGGGLSGPDPAGAATRLGEALVQLGRTAPQVQRDNDTPNLTDAGNAQRLVALFGDELRYVYESDEWLHWTGARWRVNSGSAIERCAVATARSIYEEAGQAPTKQAREALVGWAVACESWGKRQSMVASARHLLAVAPSALDADPWTLNCRNGALDLRTGELRAHDSADLCTHLVDADFDPAAQCPRWLRFLEESVPDAAERDYLQRAVGYSLSGSVREQAMVLVIGPTASGKSTFIETIGELLDGYARTATHDLLLTQREDTHPASVAHLFGARFVSSIETGEGRRLNVALVKRLTGGDTMNARKMYQDPTECAPTWKLWLGTNHKPVIAGDDGAIWRRLHLVYFPNQRDEAQWDRDLKDKLRAESPGILTWAVEGCLRWQQEGLKPTTSMREAAAVYRTEQDIIGAWLEDCCEPGGMDTVERLYASYKNWCTLNGHKPLASKGLYLKLAERGLAERDTSGHGSRRAWRGLRLRESTFDGGF